MGLSQCLLKTIAHGKQQKNTEKQNKIKSKQTNKKATFAYEDNGHPDSIGDIWVACRCLSIKSLGLLVLTCNT